MDCPVHSYNMRGHASREVKIWIVDPSGKNARKICDGALAGWAADGKTLYATNGRSKQVLAVDVADSATASKVIYSWRGGFTDPVLNGVSPDGRF